MKKKIYGKVFSYLPELKDTILMLVDTILFFNNLLEDNEFKTTFNVNYMAALREVLGIRQDVMLSVGVIVIKELNNERVPVLIVFEFEPDGKRYNTYKDDKGYYIEVEDNV